MRNGDELDTKTFSLRRMPAAETATPTAPVCEESSDDDLTEMAAITSATKCVIVGDLEVATTHTLTTFVIEAYTRDGEKQTDGGDRFLVTIRGLGVKRGGQAIGLHEEVGDSTSHTIQAGRSV